MQALYITHVTCACLSILGFVLRGFWMLGDNALREHRLARILPHILDSVLLASAIGILWQWGSWPQDLPWVMAKIGALLLYIALGMVALRFGKTRRVRGTAYVLALITAAYIVSVALSKNYWGFLQFIPF